jgi:asparagine synthase (glutamine-hydrolysing)
MPMSNADGTLHITYNGEVYNAAELRTELEAGGYVFRSNSDTEVILHGYAAWGEGVVERLRGMFAFAVLDTRPRQGCRGQLFMARDRLGVKPLYYARTGEAFIFASELKGLLAAKMVTKEWSPAALAGYLMMGAVPNPYTIYRDVRAIEPGCTLTLPLDIPAGEPKRRRYWSLPTGPAKAITHAGAVDEIRTLLEEAVRIRLVSDVPLGAFLSGGLDSSAVVALMRKATDGPIRTCSMAFEETEYSEARYAREMSRAAGTEHYERVVTAQDLTGEMDNIFAAMDQPTVDGVNSYFVSQTARQAGLTVALSGLGGDELFGGYDATFKGVPQMLRALRVAWAVPGGGALARSAIRLLPDRTRWARVEDALRRRPTPSGAYLTRRGLFSQAEVEALLTPEVWHEAKTGFDPVRHIAARTGNHVGAAEFAERGFEWTSRAELATYTHHQLLRDTDVMSMAHSLEVRVPLLDHRLVEAVLSLPSHIKASGQGPKPLLVQALGDDLPPMIRERQGKQGFTFPFDKWLRGPLRGEVETLLQSTASNGRLRPQAIEATWRAYLSGKVHWSRPWALAVLGSFSEKS